VIYGVVLFRSGYFPRLLGALYGIAGVCYLANSCAYFFARTAVSIPAAALPGRRRRIGAVAADRRRERDEVARRGGALG
jgi:hypothetical protein